MSGPRPPKLTLSPRHRALLERLARRATSPQRLVRRVAIILAASDGWNNEQLALRLGLARETVQVWRARWLAAGPRLAAAEADGSDDVTLTKLIVAELNDAPRAGAPPAFSVAQICQLLALACEPPAASGRPVTHWTPAELAAEAVQRGIVPRISARTVGRFLHRRPNSNRTARATG
jgi:putative transposase